MVALPPMPKMPRSGTRTATQRTAKIPQELDREVKWLEGKEEPGGEPTHVYGTCAKCGRRRQAIDLTWRPDRLLFGEFHLGFWACQFNCDDEG